MCAVKLETTEDRYVIYVDQRFISKVALLQLLENLRLEALAWRVDFQDDIIDLGEEMKESWWKANKWRLHLEMNTEICSN